MKINFTRCPSCGAELIAESGKRIVYCSYCQKNVSVSDTNGKPQEVDYSKVRAGRSTTRQTSGGKKRRDPKTGTATARNTQWQNMVAKEQRPSKSPAAGIIIVMAVAAVIAAIAVNLFSLFQEKSYFNTMKEQVEQVCGENGAVLTSFDHEDKEYRMEITAANSQKDEIDSIQESIIERITIKNGRTYRILFYYPENSIVRDVRIESNGAVYVDYDGSNTTDDAEIERLVSGCTEQMEKALEGTAFQIYGIEYINDCLFISLDSKTRERKQADEVVAITGDILGQFNDPHTELDICDTDGELLMLAVFTDGNGVITDDYCNTVDDAETEKIEQAFRDALETKFPTVMVRSLKLKGDELYISVVTGTAAKTILDNLESKLSEAVPEYADVTIYVDSMVWGD